DDFAHDAGAVDGWLADVGGGLFLQEQHAAEFDVGADLHIAVIDFHNIAFLHAILAGAIFEDSVHDKKVLIQQGGESGYCFKEITLWKQLSLASGYFRSDNGVRPKSEL